MAAGPQDDVQTILRDVIVAQQASNKTLEEIANHLMNSAKMQKEQSDWQKKLLDQQRESRKEEKQELEDLQKTFDNAYGKARENEKFSNKIISTGIGSIPKELSIGKASADVLNVLNEIRNPNKKSQALMQQYKNDKKDILKKASESAAKNLDHFGKSVTNATDVLNNISSGKKGHSSASIAKSLQEDIKDAKGITHGGKGILGKIGGSLIGGKGGLGKAVGGGMAGKLMGMAVESILPTPLKLLYLGIKLGKIANNLQKELADQGSITGEGRGAAVNAQYGAAKMGFNPFDRLSTAFAGEIIGAFRDKGFKGDLANSLGSSFGAVTKKMGEGLSKDLLPTVTDFASSLRASGASSAQVKEDMNAFNKSILDLYHSAPKANDSVKDLNDGFAVLTGNIMKMGGSTVETGDQVSAFLSKLFGQQGTPGGMGMSPVGGIGAVQVAQMMTQAAPYLAGRLGIAAPLAFVGDNARKVTNELYKVFADLWKAAPPEFQSNPQAYAAYLLAGYLPAIGMGGFTVDQVVGLMKATGTGNVAATIAAGTSWTKGLGLQKVGSDSANALSTLARSKGGAKNITKEDIEGIKNNSGISGYLSRGGKVEDIVSYLQNKKGDIGGGSLASFMRGKLQEGEISGNADLSPSSFAKNTLLRGTKDIQSAALFSNQDEIKKTVDDLIAKALPQLDKNSEAYRELTTTGGGINGLQRLGDITLQLNANASDQKIIAMILDGLEAKMADMSGTTKVQINQ